MALASIGLEMVFATPRRDIFRDGAGCLPAGTADDGTAGFVGSFSSTSGTTAKRRRLENDPLVGCTWPTQLGVPAVALGRF